VNTLFVGIPSRAVRDELRNTGATVFYDLTASYMQMIASIGGLTGLGTPIANPPQAIPGKFEKSAVRRYDDFISQSLIEKGSIARYGISYAAEYDCAWPRSNFVRAKVKTYPSPILGKAMKYEKTAP
jgi:hypothetical protein